MNSMNNDFENPITIEENEPRKPNVDIDSLELIHSLKIHYGVTGDSVDYAEKLGYLLIGDQGGYISVWNIKNWKKLSEIKAHSYYISDLKYFAPDSTVFTASYDKLIKIYSISVDDHLKQIKVLYQHSNQVGSMLLIASQNRLFSGGPYMNLHVWDLKNKFNHFEVQTLGKGGVSSMIVLDKHSAIAVGFIGGWLSIIDSQTGGEIDSLRVTDMYWNSTLGYDEFRDEIYGVVGYHHLKIWKLVDLKLNEIHEDKDFPGNSILSFQPCIINGRESILTTSTLSKLRYFDVETKKLKETNVRFYYFRFALIKNKKLLVLTSVQHCNIDIYRFSSMIDLIESDIP